MDATWPQVLTIITIIAGAGQIKARIDRTSEISTSKVFLILVSKWLCRLAHKKEKSHGIFHTVSNQCYELAGMQNVNVSKDKEFDIKQRPGFVYGEKKRLFE